MGPGEALAQLAVLGPQLRDVLVSQLKAVAEGPTRARGNTHGWVRSAAYEPGGGDPHPPFE